MRLERAIGVRVPGIPKPKGSKVCRVSPRHPLYEAVNNGKWRRQVRKGGAKLAERGITGPVGISVTFTLPRPAKHYGTGRNAHRVKPDAPTWPYEHGTGDVDKLCRLVFDAMQDAGVLTDDAQVVNAALWKCYPDTRGCPDRMDQPGSLIRLYPIEEDDQCQQLTLIENGQPAKSSSGTGPPPS